MPATPVSQSAISLICQSISHCRGDRLRSNSRNLDIIHQIILKKSTITMQTSRWRWGEAKTIKFVKCYKQQRCLWYPDDEGYKNKYKRELSYRAIVEAMEDDEITTTCVRTKIKNLRSTYHQELKKIKEAIENTGEPYKPQLCWFYEMDSFIGDLTDKRFTLEETIRVDLPSNSFEAEEIEEHHIKCERLSSDTEPESEVIPPEVSDVSDEPPKKRQRDVAKVSKVINRLQNIATLLDGSAKAAKEDEFYFFGLNVAAQLRKLPLEIALKMQADIQNKLYHIRVKTVKAQRFKDRDVLDTD